MSVWDDMARDGGYRGDEAREVASRLEQEEREAVEAREVAARLEQAERETILREHDEQ